MRFYPKAALLAACIFALISLHGLVHGVYDGYCGTWQSSYTQLHNNILAGKLPPRYVVSVAVEAGMADRITGTITEFFLALLTKRAFQIVTYGALPAFEDAYSQPNINWSRPADPDWLTMPVRFSYRGSRSYGPEVNTSKYWPVFMVNDNAGADDVFGKRDLRKFPTGHHDVETLVMSSNRGRTVKLFENPYHALEMYKMGLTPHTAFACAYRYLFAALPEVEAIVKTEMTYLSNEKAFKIGINIRSGDHMFESGTQSFSSQADSYFECAKQITRDRSYPNQTVIWYLTSDSRSLRQHYAGVYPDKILANVNANIQHTNCHALQFTKGEGCTKDITKRKLAIRTAVAEWHAFSLADVHIYTRYSGFGRMGAWLSGRFHNLYGSEGVNTCGLRDDTNIWPESTFHSGV